MIIMITLDSNYQKIWEKSGTATFDSYYEGTDKIQIIQKDIPKTLYAIGVYRSRKSLPQEFSPSLLQITRVNVLSENTKRHDIEIDFDFLKKLPMSVNSTLHKMIPESTPLIRYINDSHFFKLQKIKNFDEL